MKNARRIFSPVTSGLLLLLLLACAPQNIQSPHLTRLKQISMDFDPFTQTLVQGYRDYADASQQAGSMEAAYIFTEKGLRAADNQFILPENPISWFTEKQNFSMLTLTHERLMALLDHPQIDKEPVLTAKTILAYDCWVEQQANTRNIKQMRLCQQGYFELYAKLDAALDAHEMAEEEALALIKAAEEKAARLAAEQAALAAEQNKPEQVQSTSSVIYFPFDSAIPGENAQTLLDELIGYVLRIELNEALIHGHADRAGPAHYNLRLSEQRAAYVRSRLVAAGVDDAHIQHYGFGESDPQIPTADGVREAANRRVEIFIQ
jgi:OOP family OmpA-OmpF porin